MRLFLSYAHEDKEMADALTLALRQAGYEVFFDRDGLPAGEGFNVPIRQAVEGSDGVVFLVSPESVKPGAFTLSELDFARRQWKDPSRHVLPVMVKPTPYADIPAYLRAVTVLERRGNLVADTVARADELWRGQRLSRRWSAAVALLLTLVGAFSVWRARQSSASPCGARVTMHAGTYDGADLLGTLGSLGGAVIDERLVDKIQGRTITLTSPWDGVGLGLALEQLSQELEVTIVCNAKSGSAVIREHEP